MSIFSRFLPKRKPPEIKNNIPKEKANIRKTFGRKREKMLILNHLSIICYIKIISSPYYFKGKRS